MLEIHYSLRLDYTLSKENEYILKHLAVGLSYHLYYNIPGIKFATRKYWPIRSHTCDCQSRHPYRAEQIYLKLIDQLKISNRSCYICILTKEVID